MKTGRLATIFERLKRIGSVSVLPLIGLAALLYGFYIWLFDDTPNKNYVD